MQPFLTGTVKLAGVALSVGFVTWILRATSLLSALLSSMPLWSRFDPLPVLAMSRRERKRMERQAALDESVEGEQLGELLDAVDELCGRPKSEE